jgi:acetoin utilization protein AcuB
MRVRELMTPDPIVVWPSTSVLYARRLLERHGIRHLPVMAGSRLVGIVSARDIQLTDRLLATTLSALHSDLVNGRYRPIETVMSRPVLAVGPEVQVHEAARLMAERRIGALPVLEDERLVGILTTTDCLLALMRAEERDAARGPVLAG